ncbi:MAG: hypothetical protein D6753_13835 [Planctomycetota bacterium]|nr:MAG: hypothetical protein D6753_13835 [Planctomycetota bacterium]
MPETEPQTRLATVLRTLLLWQRSDATNAELRQAIQQWLRETASAAEADRIENGASADVLIDTVVRRALVEHQLTATGDGATSPQRDLGAATGRSTARASTQPIADSTRTPAASTSQSQRVHADGDEDFAEPIGWDWWGWYYYLDEQIYALSLGFLTIGRIFGMVVVAGVLAVFLLVQPEREVITSGTTTTQSGTNVPELIIIGSEDAAADQPAGASQDAVETDVAGDESTEAAAADQTGAATATLDETRASPPGENYQPRELPDFSPTRRRPSLTQIVEMLNRRQWDRALEALQPWIDDPESTNYADARILRIAALMEKADHESRVTAWTELAAIPESQADRLCHLLTAYWVVMADPQDIEQVEQSEAAARPTAVSWLRLKDEERVAELEKELTENLGGSPSTLGELLLLATIHEKTGQSSVARVEYSELRRQIMGLEPERSTIAQNWLTNLLRTRLLVHIDGILNRLRSEELQPS